MHLPQMLSVWKSLKFCNLVKNKHNISSNRKSFVKLQILVSSKLEESGEDNFKLDEKGRKFSQWLENTVGKGSIAH